MRRFLIFLIAGWSGFFVMGVELLSGRLIAPWFGSSIYVWGAIITVFMLALSLGYLLGGRFSLYAPSLTRLAVILLAAAATALPIPFIADSIMKALFAVIRDPRYGSLLVVILLFFVPTAISGMVSPYAVRLLARDRDHSGQAAGLLYFISTLGSAAGTLATAFYLVLYLELNHILWIFTGLSALLGAAAMLYDRKIHAHN